MSDAPFSRFQQPVPAVAVTRHPPQNIEAEQALLGAILTNNKAYERVALYLKAEHFVVVCHQKIYQAIVDIIANGGMADAITLSSQFRNTDDLDGADGGVAYLGRLLTAMVGIINAAEYGKAIFDAFLRRQMIETAETLLNAAYAGKQAVPDMATVASADLDKTFAGAALLSGRATMVSLGEAVQEVLVAGDEAFKNGGMSPGIRTGFRGIDRVMGGMETGTLTILGGRPAMGKSALAMQIAENVARGGEPVLVISLEMQAKQLGRRVLAAATGLSVGDLKRGEWGHRGPDLVATQKSLAGMPLLIEDQQGLSLGMIAARARAAKRRFGRLGLLVIDHLHIVAPNPADARQGETHAVGQISTGLKRLAKQLEIPVLALAQLSRGVEGRDDKRPTMNDLRQSGNIEQDAEAIMFVYRAEYYLSKSPPEPRANHSGKEYSEMLTFWENQKAEAAGKAEIIFAKVRDGMPDTVPMGWDGPRTAFRDRPGEDPYEP